jgi:hypothetical protein
VTTFDSTFTGYLDGPWLARHAEGVLANVPTGGSEHGAVLVGVGSDVAWIDLPVAPLIHSMWRAGIYTENSCGDIGGDGRLAFVAFDESCDADLFLRLVTALDEDEPGGIWDRATGSNLDTTADAWEWTTFPKVIGGRVWWQLSVVFPVSDVPHLVGRLTGQEKPAVR